MTTWSSRTDSLKGVAHGLSSWQGVWDQDAQRNILAKFTVVTDKDGFLSLKCNVKEHSEDGFEGRICDIRDDYIFSNGPWKDPFSKLEFAQQAQLLRGLAVDKTIVAFT